MLRYELIRSERKTLSAEIRQGRLIVRVPCRATDAEIDAFLHRHRRWIETKLSAAQERQRAAESRPLTLADVHALAERALQIIPARVAYFAPLVGVTYGRITIRNQRTRWGSCSPKGDLNFNCLLLLAPPEVLDSVVVHELCHRKEMNHSRKFYAEVLRVFPRYPECRKWLKQNGGELLARMGG